MPVRCSDPVAWAAAAIRRGCRARGEDAVVVDTDPAIYLEALRRLASGAEIQATWIDSFRRCEQSVMRGTTHDFR